VWRSVGLRRPLAKEGERVCAANPGIEAAVPSQVPRDVQQEPLRTATQKRSCKLDKGQTNASDAHMNLPLQEINSQVYQHTCNVILLQLKLTWSIVQEVRVY
jgi:hypothetical protein